MNHKYIPSQIDSSKCQVCKYDVMSHTDMATCDACTYIGPVEIYMTMKMCPDCIVKEQAAQNKLKETESERVNSLLGKAKEIDYSVEVKNDIFNAETISFKEIMVTIESDEKITNKPFELAKIVKERILHFQKTFFDKQDELKEIATRQRFWQEQANQLASKLRKEEREQIQLKNINYKPTTEKISKPKAITTKKFDKAELVEWANKGGWPLSVLQTVCTARGMTPKQAYEFLTTMKPKES